MTRRLLLPLFLVSLGSGLPAQDASVTLFTNGRMLVRRTLTLPIPAGSSSQTLALGLFDAPTLTSLDPGVSFTRINHDPTVGEDALLRRSVGKTFNYVKARNGEIGRAMLVAVDPERWRLDPEGVVVFGRPGQLQWAADMVPKSSTTEVQVQSDRARPAVRVMYQESGAGWAAQYRIFVGSAARVEGSALLQSGRLDLANAEVQLLAGDIGAPPNGRMDNVMAMDARVFAAKEAAPPTEEGLGEVHLYTLADRVSFMPGTQTVVPLFAPATATAERRYTVRGALPWYGGMGQEPGEQEIPVAVTWRLDRKLGTTFGDLPMPAGSVAIFDVDKSGRTQLIGQGSIGHTAAGNMLSVSTGTAFDITAKRTQTEYTMTRPSTTRTVTTFGYSVVIANAKDSAVVVEVIEQRSGEWSVLASSVPAQRRSSTVTAFVVPVVARGTTTLTYRLRVTW